MNLRTSTTSTGSFTTTLEYADGRGPFESKLTYIQGRLRNIMTDEEVSTSTTYLREIRDGLREYKDEEPLDTFEARHRVRELTFDIEHRLGRTVSDDDIDRIEDRLDSIRTLTPPQRTAVGTANPSIDSSTTSVTVTMRGTGQKEKLENFSSQLRGMSGSSSDW